MRDLKLKQSVQKILDIAGIKINGKKDWDIIVNDNRFYQRVLAQGSLGLGESYMNGLWDCKKLDEFFYRVLKANLNKKVRKKGFLWDILKVRVINMQSKARAYNIGEKHYDIGNEFYKNMLDKRMNYSCGYWKNAKTLDKAQEAKLDLICKKIGLKPGMKVLDIGCGWGGFVKFATEKYKVKAIGITVSKEQAKLARESCKGLSFEIRLQDYRKLNEKFDRIISIGMFEHVGPKNYKTYMRVVNRCLKPEGLFLLHTIGRNVSTKSTERWLDKYIFPNGILPSVKQIAKASEGLFVLEDWHNFGTDYDKTLMAWHHNFEKNWNKIKGNYSKKFKRMWRYYLLSCAGSFRAEKNRLWQIVFSKGNIREYKSIR
jgi:cyclopropane-fatty-acyl-phospholipid synthase